MAEETPFATETACPHCGWRFPEGVIEDHWDYPEDGPPVECRMSPMWQKYADDEARTVWGITRPASQMQDEEGIDPEEYAMVAALIPKDVRLLLSEQALDVLIKEKLR